MKQKYMIYGLLALLSAGCSDELQERVADREQVQVTAGINNSRVSFESGEGVTYAYWQNGDEITLSSSTQGSFVYEASVSGTSAASANFTAVGTALKDNAGETIYACYPSGTVTGSTVALPATNTWKESTPLPFAYAVSTIRNSSLNLQFDHIFSFLKLTLKKEALQQSVSTDGDKTIHRIRVCSAIDSLSVLSGTFDMASQSMTLTESSNGVDLTLASPYNPENSDEQKVYIPVLPQRGGIEMNIYALHDHESGCDTLYTITKNTPSSGFVKGNVYNLTLTADNSGTITGDEAVIFLSSAGSLSDFITDANKNTIRKLTIKGYLNGDDIRLIREMAGRDVNGAETEGILEELNVEEANIVAGGGAYYIESSTRAETLSFYTSDDVWGAYFFAATKLKNVSLPLSITFIGEAALANCTGLTSIEIPQAVTEVDSLAFFYCENLGAVSFADNTVLNTIDEMAFAYCTSLPTISIPQTVAAINYGAFAYCTSLGSIDLANNTLLTTIESATFASCTSLAEISIPENVTSIGYDAFEMCESLTAVEIPAKVELIDDYAFYACSSLESVSFAANSSLSFIGRAAFEYCSSLSAISIPQPVESIGAFAFNECTAMKSVSFAANSSLSSIGYGAFASCASLSAISIPQPVETIDAFAFYGCGAMESVSFAANSSLSSIGRGAFASCTSLSAISIPQPVESIGAFAFDCCEAMKSVSFAEDAALAVIDTVAFQSCESLTEISIPAKVSSIGINTFWGCSSLESVSFAANSSLSSIGRGAFEYCTSLSAISIPQPVESIGVLAFDSCVALKSLSFTDDAALTVIGQHAFEQCESLTEVVIPAKVESLEKSAFNLCTSLASVSFAENSVLSTIGDFAFYDCIFSDITLPGSLTSIGEVAFYNVPLIECESGATTPPALGANCFTGADADATLYVPVGYKSSYSASDWANYFANIREKGVAEGGDTNIDDMPTEGW